MGEGPLSLGRDFFFPSALTPISCLLFIIKQNLFHFSWCERTRVLSKMQRQRSSVTAGLLNPFSPPVPVPDFPKVLTCQRLLLTCHGQLTPKGPRRSDAAAAATTTTSHSVSCSKDVTCCEAFTVLFPSCLQCCISFFWCFCHAAVLQRKEKFSGTKVKNPYYLTTGIWASHGKEGNYEGSRASVLGRQEFASW